MFHYLLIYYFLFNALYLTYVNQYSNTLFGRSPYAIRPLPLCLAVCPVWSCLTVTLVYCGQTVGWIKVKLGTQIGLDPVHLVGTELPSHKGAQPPILSNVHCGQTAGWIKMSLGTQVGFGPSTLCSMGTQLPPRKKGHSAHIIFGPCLLWPNGWIDQAAIWYGGKPQPRRRCVRWGSSSPLKGWIKTPVGRDLGPGLSLSLPAQHLPLPQIFPTIDSLPALGLTPRTSRLDRFF